MAHFTIQLKDNGITANCKFTFTNDCFDICMPYLREQFEIEIMQGKIMRTKIETVVKFKTDKLDLVKAMRENAIERWMEYTKTKPSNN